MRITAAVAALGLGFTMSVCAAEAGVLGARSGANALTQEHAVNIRVQCTMEANARASGLRRGYQAARWFFYRQCLKRIGIDPFSL